MSANTPSGISSPQRPSIIQAFLTAPTLVKALVCTLYLPALLYAVAAIWTVAFPQTWTTDPNVTGSTVVVAVGFLIVALTAFLLGNALARGAHGAWLLTLVLALLVLAYDLFQMFTLASSDSIVNAGAAVIVLGLQATPEVRQHCTKN